jgi:hypothetical protein
MADSNSTQAPAAATPQPAEAGPATTLPPQEYLRWLLSLEKAADLPEGTRAYIVSFDHAGARRLTPVGDQDAVVNLETDLPKHLRDRGLSTEALTATRDVCDEMLGERGEEAQFDRSRIAVALRAAWQIESFARLVEENRDDSNTQTAIVPMLRRIQLLSGAIMTALEEEDEPIDEMAKLVDQD